MTSAARPSINLTQVTLIALGFISLGLWLAVPPTLGTFGRPHILDYLPLYFALFVPYVAAIVITLRDKQVSKALGSTSSPNTSSPNALLLTFLFAIIFRLTLLSHPPTLSSDVYRYIWDGHLQTEGMNPYQYAVDSPALDPYATPLRERVNNATLASPYLPVAQIVFAIAYRLGPDSPLTFQLTAVIFDLLTGVCIVLALKRLGKPVERVLIYLWNPLIVVEFAQGAHIDTLMICLMLASLAAYVRNEKSYLSPILLALATLVKPIPALLLPLVGPRWGWRGLLVYAGTMVLGLLPYAGAGLGLDLTRPGTGLFGSMLIYLRFWNFNGGLYHWIEILTTGKYSEGALPPDLPGVLEAKAICAALLLGVLVWAWRKSRASILPHRRGINPPAEKTKSAEAGWDNSTAQLWWLPIAGYLFLAPTVHPWYLAALIALLPFASNSVLVLLYWSASVGLSYLAYLDPHNPREYDWVRQWEYWPLFGLIAIAYIQRRTRALYDVYASPNLRSK